MTPIRHELEFVRIQVLKGQMQTLTTTAIGAINPAKTATVSSYARTVLAGATSIVIGILWDISWHRTIGRDTFWTPAHIAIYLGGLAGGLTCGWLVIRTTFFATPREQAGAVRLWGFRAPFGAWLTIWGSLAMMTSAPFDNWWHNAYGLDVRILSPPHTILALGMWAIVLGALMLVLREQNLASPEQQAPGRRLYLYASGVLIVMASIILIEYSFPNQQRTQTFYQVSAATFPLYLLGLARASKFRWGATWIALIYMAILAFMAWVLQIFPGHPRLGPIYNPVTHFVPMPFPLLLVVPAMAIDLVRGWIGHGRGWLRDWLMVVLIGISFFVVFLVTQWLFSAFLIGPGGQNWFFLADRHWGYTEHLGDWRTKFWSGNPFGNTPLTVKGSIVAILLAIAASRVGLWLGNWMARIKR